MILYASVLLLLLIVFVLCSAWFSSAEMALFSIPRAQIYSYAKETDPAKKRIFQMMKDYELTLITIILGNMFVNSCISMLNNEFLNTLDLDETTTMILSVVIGVVILLLFGEITPMSLAYSHADAWSQKVAGPLFHFRRLLLPLTRGMEKICDRALDALGRQTPQPLTQSEYLSYLDSCVEHGAFTERQANLLKETFA